MSSSAAGSCAKPGCLGQAQRTATGRALRRESPRGPPLTPDLRLELNDHLAERAQAFDVYATTVADGQVPTRAPAPPGTRSAAPRARRHRGPVAWRPSCFR